jgi:hypothetical protein
MNLNPNAVVMWALFGVVGYLIGGTQACLIGVAAGLGISLLLSLLSR